MTYIGIRCPFSEHLLPILWTFSAHPVSVQCSSSEHLVKTQCPSSELCQLGTKVQRRELCDIWCLYVPCVSCAAVWFIFILFLFQQSEDFPCASRSPRAISTLSCVVFSVRQTNWLINWLIKKNIRIVYIYHLWVATRTCSQQTAR
jgi:hypothetical protein